MDPGAQTERQAWRTGVRQPPEFGPGMASRGASVPGAWAGYSFRNPIQGPPAAAIPYAVRVMTTVGVSRRSGSRTRSGAARRGRGLLPDADLPWGGPPGGQGRRGAARCRITRRPGRRETVRRRAGKAATIS
jgi:hypothetical protein